MEKVYDFLSALWSKDSVQRFVHTAWQAFIAVFLAGIFDVFSAFQNGGLSAGKSALVALVSAAIAATLSALKSAYLSRRV